MYSVLKSLGIFLVAVGLGSFVLPLLGGDSFILQWLGKARGLIMCLTTMVGMGLIGFAYVIQQDEDDEDEDEDDEDDDDDDD